MLHQLMTRMARRFSALMQKPKLEREMDDEMRLHLELETADLVRERGLSPEAARRKAHIAFGGVERFKEEGREARGTRWAEDFAGDLKYGARTLRRAPGFAISAGLTLALGIGVTTALFSVVEAVLLQPLPFGDPSHTVAIWSSWKDYPKTWVSYDEYELYRDQTKTFDEVALYSSYSATLTGNGEPLRIRAGDASANIFRALRVGLPMGRTFSPEEDAPGGPQVALIGHAIWQQRYASDPAVIGRTVELNGFPLEIIGVLPAGFRMPLDYGVNGQTQVLTATAAVAESLGAIAGPATQQGGGSHGMYVVAHLAPGVTVEQANRTLHAINDRLTAEGIYPQIWHFRAIALALRDQISGPMRPVLIVLLGAVTFVLLIACANVAGLLFVRGERRRREMALRAVLGAGGRRLARQFLTEGLLLAALGGSLGIALAWALVAATRAWAPASLPLVREVSLNPRVLLFAVATTLGTVVLFALAPAFAATRIRLSAAMRDGGRGTTTGRTRLHARQLLVTAEIALAVTIIVGGGLMVRTVQRLLAIDPGFRRENVLTMELATPSTRYATGPRVSGFFDELRRNVARLPGVQAVGAARQLPLAREIGDWGLRVEGYTPPPDEGTPGDWQVVTPGYFEAMGMRLIAGRFFDERDGTEGAPAIIISKRLADKYLAGREPLGARIKIGNPDNPWTTVVGVVGDVEHNALTGEIKPTFYAPHAQFHISMSPYPPRTMTLAIRTTAEPAALVAGVRAAARAIDPQIPIDKIRSMDEIVQSSVAPQQFGMMLLAAFGGLALVLAMVGIYGVVAQVVSARMPEFGVRSALGASPASLVRLSLTSGGAPIVVGLVVGTLAALALTRLLSGILYGVAPNDPATFLMATVTTGVAALAACWIPARKAGRADPATALLAD